MTELKGAFAAQVIDAATAAIAAAWPEIPVYDEAIPQNLQEPSFSLRCIDAAQLRFMGERWRAKCSLRIYFFPPAERPWRATAEALEGLSTALEIIECKSGSVRGGNMQAHVEDDVGVFTVDYEAFLIRRADMEAMEEIDFKIIGMKEDKA